MLLFEDVQSIDLYLVRVPCPPKEPFPSYENLESPTAPLESGIHLRGFPKPEFNLCFAFFISLGFWGFGIVAHADPNVVVGPIEGAAVEWRIGVLLGLLVDHVIGGELVKEANQVIQIILVDSEQVAGDSSQGKVIVAYLYTPAVKANVINRSHPVFGIIHQGTESSPAIVHTVEVVRP